MAPCNGYLTIDFFKIQFVTFIFTDVPMWLKSLRLHKYSHIFSDITYEQMLNLTEDYLDQKGVTKGARNKIILYLQKIKERKSTLLQLEKVTIFYLFPNFFWNVPGSFIVLPLIFRLLNGLIPYPCPSLS